MAKTNTLLMVGTAKGLFILRENGGKWSLDGPHFAGLAVYSAFLDQRQGRNTMWAAPASWHFGAELCCSTDMGKTWDMPEKRRIKMPAATKKPLENIWQITAGGKDDTLVESITKSVARSASSSIGRQIGNSIVRGVLGSILGGKGKSGWF